MTKFDLSLRNFTRRNYNFNNKLDLIHTYQSSTGFLAHIRKVLCGSANSSRDIVQQLCMYKLPIHKFQEIRVLRKSWRVQLFFVYMSVYDKQQHFPLLVSFARTESYHFHLYFVYKDRWCLCLPTPVTKPARINLVPAGFSRMTRLCLRTACF